VCRVDLSNIEITHLVKQEKGKAALFTAMFEEPVNELMSGGANTSNPFTAHQSSSNTGSRIAGRISIGSHAAKGGQSQQQVRV